MTDLIERLLTEHKRVSGMVSVACLRDILGGLESALDRDVPGDVVELGCNVGTTSLFISRYLLARNERDREFHVYDSWQGLPQPSELDVPERGAHPNHREGGVCASIDDFWENYEQADLPLPCIHSGWFLDQLYPQRIAFAFFDGDLYQSIRDSFSMVWPRLSPGGVVVVHDYEYEWLPGVKRACNDFGVQPVKGTSHTGMVVKG